MPKIKVFRISTDLLEDNLLEDGSQQALEHLAKLLEMLPIDETNAITIEALEMEQEEFDKLEEYDI